jgi:rhodanese-related sulfurtransferase
MTEDLKSWRLLRKTFSQGAIILALSGLPAVFSFRHASPLHVAAGKESESSPQSEIERVVDLEMLEKWVEAGEVICIDARSTREYAKSHILGAISLPLSDLDSALAQNLDLLTGRKKLVVYCSGEDCDLSEILASKLAAIGFENVAIFTGGMKAWMSASLPTAP